MPEPLRENYQRLLNDMQANIINDVARGRTLEAAEVKRLMDEAPLSAVTAEKAKLVDKVDYLASALEAVRRAAPYAAALSIGDYASGLESLPGAKTAPHVGMVYIDGAIMRRADGYMPGADGIAASENIVPGLMELAEDDSIKAVVVRINSPGGSVTASEAIRHGVTVLRAKGKYVVVSMGDTAASGGYWVASAADRILASPSTITGSIGVFGGKFAVGPLAEKLGVSFGELSTGQMSGLTNLNRPFNEIERQRLNTMFDETYEAFTLRVAESRNLTPDHVDKLARGRVWSGQAALEGGLVDELGGMREAFMDVRRHLKLAEDAPLRLILAPKADDPYTKALKLLRGYIGLPEWLGRGLVDLALLHQGLAYQGPRVAY
jgi:protease IV